MPVEEEVIPLVEERANIGTIIKETGKVQIRTHADVREELVRAELTREDVEVRRVAIDRAIDAVPGVRQEGDVTIVPVVEEVLVVEKRLVLVEEIHLRRTRKTEQISQPVKLATQRAEIVRHQTSGEDDKSNREVKE